MTGTTETRPEHIKFSGRILFLTDDTALIRQQLEASGDAAVSLEAELAARLLNGDLPLMSNISTDEITPGWVCFYYDETLGQYVYVGMREGAVKKDEVKNGGFAVVVSGLSKGHRTLPEEQGASRKERTRTDGLSRLSDRVRRDVSHLYRRGSVCPFGGGISEVELGVEL